MSDGSSYRFEIFIVTKELEGSVLAWPFKPYATEELSVTNKNPSRQCILHVCDWFEGLVHNETNRVVCRRKIDPQLPTVFQPDGTVHVSM